ncbi:MAG: head GIN domain-containing protein [Ginsengibacter sp.]
MRPIFVISFFSIVFFSSCHFIGRDRIKGDGNVITQRRSISEFKSVDVSSSILLYVRQDSAFSVKVEADNNLQQYIETYKDNDGVLHIHQRDNTNLDGSKKIKVYVTAPLFEQLEASGACNIIGENGLSSTGIIHIQMSGASDADLEIKAPKVMVDLTGASSVTLRGQTKDFSVDGSGSSDINCFGLMTENSDIELSGAGNAEVFASVKLDVHVSGAADIKYKGNAIVNKEISGAGSVKKVD